MYSQRQKSMSGCGALYYLNTLLLKQQSRVVDILNIVPSLTSGADCTINYFKLLNFEVKISI